MELEFRASRMKSEHRKASIHTIHKHEDEL